MKKKFRQNECNILALNIGKSNMKGVIITPDGNVKNYVVHYHKDLKNWRNIFFKETNTEVLQYKAFEKILSKVYKDTKINKFAIGFDIHTNNKLSKTLKTGQVFVLKRLFRKIDLEITDIFTAVDSKNASIIDTGKSNTKFQNQPIIAVDTGKSNTKSINDLGVFDIGRLNSTVTMLDNEPIIIDTEGLNTKVINLDRY